MDFARRACQAVPRLVQRGALPGFGPRGGDIDSKGVVWVSLASGHMGSFDRRK